MRYIAGYLLLIIWMLFTLILLCTILGILVVLEDPWQNIPKQIFLNLNK